MSYAALPEIWVTMATAFVLICIRLKYKMACYSIFAKNYIKLKYSGLNYGNKEARVRFTKLVTNSAGILKVFVAFSFRLSNSTRFLIRK